MGDLLFSICGGLLLGYAGGQVHDLIRDDWTGTLLESTARRVAAFILCSAAMLCGMWLLITATT